jgi:Caspase domain/Bacterial PH domain
MTADQRYRGLLIGNAVFPRDPHALQSLCGPSVDIEELEQALTDDQVGLFSPGNVQRLPDKGVQELRECLDEFFTAAVRDDVLLLYYSGHGQLDELGGLYLCARDTMRDRLRATALSAAEINNMIAGSAATTIIIVLDCCHSGAFKTGADLAAAMKGKGRYVLASNRSTELARAADVEGQPSPFTSMLVRGLRHAETTGHLTVGELYRQVHRWMTHDTTLAPQLRMAGEGDVVIARRSGGTRTDTQQRRHRAPFANDVAAETGRATAKPFEESWTGDEDLKLFTKRRNLELAMSLWALFCGGLGLDSVTSSVGDSAGTILARAIFIIGLSAAGVVLPNLVRWGDRRRLRKSLPPRTLRIDGDGVTATDPSGTQHIPWTAIRRVGVHYTDRPKGYGSQQLLAVHLQMNAHAEDSPLILYRPVGWPADADLPAIFSGPAPPKQDDWLPVCVLGPLPELRRIDMKNTVAAFTKRPLEMNEAW